MQTYFHKIVIAAGLVSLAATGHAAQLVTNGSFESGPQFGATGWTIPDLGTAPDGDPANYARVGNFASQVGTDPNGFAFAPYGAGNGTGTQIPTRTVYMGGLNPRTSIIQQNINTAGYVGGSASLTFKLVYEDLDIAGRDFFHVDFGTNRLLTVDLGAAWVNWVNQFGVVRQGGVHFWTLTNPVLDLSPYLDGTTKPLVFTLINDRTPSSSSAAWIDNVSINAAVAVPEPAAGLPLAVATLALLKRRR